MTDLATDLMNVVYDPKEIFPPTVGNILVQLNDQDEWHIVFFDPTIMNKGDLEVYDENDDLIGVVTAWKHTDENLAQCIRKFDNV